MGWTISGAQGATISANGRAYIPTNTGAARNIIITYTGDNCTCSKVITQSGYTAPCNDYTDYGYGTGSATVGKCGGTVRVDSSDIPYTSYTCSYVGSNCQCTESERGTTSDWENITIGPNTTSSVQTHTGTKGNISYTITQEAGPCSSCTEENVWDKTDEEACDGHCGETVTVTGKHIYSDCTTASTSHTVSCPACHCTEGDTWEKTDEQACDGHCGETVTVNGVHTNTDCSTASTSHTVSCPSCKPVSAVSISSAIISHNGRVYRCPDGAPSVSVTFTAYCTLRNGEKWFTSYTGTATSCSLGDDVTVSWPSDVDWNADYGTMGDTGVFSNGSDTYDDGTTIWVVS